MKTILLALILLSTSCVTDTKETVYISTGGKAYAYHLKKSCRTLKKCVEEGHVKAISLEEAKEIGRVPCKVCSRNI